jgi:hypothetical protein
MKPPHIRIPDGGPQRCLACGHPRKEHRADECTVPKCGCPEYASRDSNR